MIKHGLNARDCYVLEKLKQGAQSPGNLSDSIMTAAYVTQIADKLLKKKLIKRSHSKDDRRKVIMSITDAGREVLK